MTLLHLWHSRGWRGGENQFRLLASHLDEPWRGRLGAPDKSELAKRLGGLLPLHPLASNGLFDVRSMIAARRLVRHHGIGIIHAHDAHALTTAILSRLGMGVKVVASRRNAYPISSGWKYRAADIVIAVSQAAAAELARVGVPHDRIAVIPDAIDTKALDAMPLRLGIAGGEKIVLCVAALSPEKDHETLLEAWAQVEKQDEKAHLLLAGSGPLEQKLHDRLAKLGLRRVRILGWRDDIAELVAGADIVTLAARSEGFASSLCQAQAAGKAVVATRAGGIPEAVEEGRTALLSAVGDARALGENLLLLLADQDRRRAMGEVGRARALANYAPEKIARAHEAIYGSLRPA